MAMARGSDGRWTGKKTKTRPISPTSEGACRLFALSHEKDIIGYVFHDSAKSRIKGKDLTITMLSSLIYVVYHYSRASAEGGKYSVISGIQRVSMLSSTKLKF